MGLRSPRMAFTDARVVRARSRSGCVRQYADRARFAHFVEFGDLCRLIGAFRLSFRKSARRPQGRWVSQTSRYTEKI